MEKLKWDQSLSVGVAEIDREHRQIIGVFNLLISDSEVNVQSETISEILHKLTQYSQSHFKTEEDLMTKHGYPDLAGHKKSHIEFKEKMLEFCQGAMKYKETLPTELFHFIKDWLYKHIREEDMKYVSFFKEQGVK